VIGFCSSKASKFNLSLFIYNPHRAPGKLKIKRGCQFGQPLLKRFFSRLNLSSITDAAI